MSLWEIFRGWFNYLLQAISDWANPGQKEAKEKNAARIQAEDAVHEAHEAAGQVVEREIDHDLALVAEHEAEGEQVRKEVAHDTEVIQAAKSFDDLFPPKKGS